MSRGEVIGLLGGTFNEDEKVLKVGKGVQSNNVEEEDIYLLLTILCVRSDLCSRAMQQREHRFAVRDGPGVSDTGLRRAVVPGLQCGGLVPLTPLLPPQPFRTGHKHTGPVPGKMN